MGFLVKYIGRRSLGIGISPNHRFRFYAEKSILNVGDICKEKEVKLNPTMMKTYLKKSLKSFDYYNLIKAVSLFSWIILLIVASTNNFLIETFIFSMAIIYIAYYTISKRSKSDIVISSEGNTRKSRNIKKSEGYLNVFFAS